MYIHIYIYIHTYIHTYDWRLDHGPHSFDWWYISASSIASYRVIGMRGSISTTSNHFFGGKIKVLGFRPHSPTEANSWSEKLVKHENYCWWMVLIMVLIRKNVHLNFFLVKTWLNIMNDILDLGKTCKSYTETEIDSWECPKSSFKNPENRATYNEWHIIILQLYSRLTYISTCSNLICHRTCWRV